MKIYNPNEIWVKPRKEFLQLPYVISFPRTGTHWLNIMLELYFVKNRVIPNFPGAITFVNKTNEDFMWYSAHDAELNLQPPVSKLGTLYLYRDPVDTLHSLMQAHMQSPDDDEKNLSSKDLLKKWTNRCYKHLYKWFISDTHKARTNISYEELKKDPGVGLKKAIRHFRCEYFEERSKKVVSKITKDLVHKRGSKIMPTYFGKQYLSDDYEDKKEKFRKIYGNYIYSTIITDDLKL